MKISQMTNDQATQAIIRLAQPMSNIMDDPNAEGVLGEIADQKGKKMINIISTLLPKVVAFCMKDHKKDLYEIVGALMMIPTAQVGTMNFVQTIKELKESIDQDFLDFFKSSGNATAEPGKE